MAPKHQVLIVQKGSSLPEGLRQSLQTKGFATQVVVADSEIVQFLDGKTESVVLVYCSPDEDMKAAVAALAEMTLIHGHPIIVVGRDVDKFESALNKHFILATTITSPCSNSDVVAAVEYVIKYVEKIGRKLVERSITEIAEADAQTVHGLYKQFDSIPTLIFDQLVKLGVMQTDLGGSEYACTFRPDKLQERVFLPASPAVCRHIADIADALTDHKVGRYFRIGLLSNSLFKIIGISGELLESARRAAFLYSSSYIVDNRDLVMKEYISSSSMNLRKELCSRIKDSAMNVQSDYNDNQTGKLIALVARYVGGEEVPSDSVENLIASAIASADLVDRLVYQQGTFQPVSAYCLLAKLKSHPLSQIHPLILGCIIKILAEAVTTEASALLKSRKLKQMASLMNAAEPIKDAVLSPNESQVPLAALSPGMRTSQPISTFDGKELLKEAVTLDQDLIWRLWQLSAIRPLNGPVIVANEH